MRNFLHKKRKEPLSGDVPLQITAMADIFTVLLVFLLKSYSTSAISPTGGSNLLLAEARAGDTTVEAIKLGLTETAVLVEGQPVSVLQGFKFDSKDIQQNGTSRSLAGALEQSRKRQLLIAKANTDVKVDPKIIIIADKRAPYGTIKSVLASAAVHGYTDFKLATVKGD